MSRSWLGRAWLGRARVRRGACGDWETLAARAAVEDLPAEVGRALAAHTAGCTRCRASAERQGQLTRLLGSVSRPAWPDDRPLLPPAAAAIAAQSRGASLSPRGSAGLEASVARGGERPRVGPIPALAVLLLLLSLVLIVRRPAHPAWRFSLVSPADGLASAWSVATIGAAVEPPLTSESLRLLVDGRDVTGASDVTPEFVLFSTPEPLSPGDHLITIEVRDQDGAPLDEGLWIVTAEPTRWPAETTTP